MEVLSEAWPWKVFPTSGKEFKRYPPTPVPSCRIYYMDSHSHNPLQILVELMEFSLISQINKEKESLSLGIMIQETVLAYWIIPPGHRGSSGCASVYCHGRLHGRKVEILPGYCQWRSIVQPRKEGRRTFARRRSKCASSFKDHGSRGLQLLLAADACCIFHDRSEEWNDEIWNTVALAIHCPRWASSPSWSCSSCCCCNFLPGSTICAQ